MRPCPTRSGSRSGSRPGARGGQPGRRPGTRSSARTPRTTSSGCRGGTRRVPLILALGVAAGRAGDGRRPGAARARRPAGAGRASGVQRRGARGRRGGRAARRRPRAGAGPRRRRSGVALPARRHERRQVPDLAEADTGLRAALPQVADALADLDVARWRPEVADELMALRRTEDLAVPDGIDSTRPADGRAGHAVPARSSTSRWPTTAARSPLRRPTGGARRCCRWTALRDGPWSPRAATPSADSLVLVMDSDLDAPEDPADHADRRRTGPASPPGSSAPWPRFGVEVLDIEQILLRGRLVLGVLVTAPRGWKDLRDAVEKVGADLDLEVTVEKGHGDNESPAQRPEPRHRAGHPAQGRRGLRHRRPDRRRRREHRPHRADGALPGHRDRPARLRCRPGPAPAGARRGGGPAAGRRRRAAGEPAAPRHAARRHGRRLDAGPGRGHRDARRARRLPGRGRARSPRRRCAASSTSSSPCASGSRCSRGSTRAASTTVYDSLVLDPRRADAGADAQAARLPVRDRLRRVQPDHRPARRRSSASTSPRPTSSRSSTAG